MKASGFHIENAWFTEAGSHISCNSLEIFF